MPTPRPQHHSSTSSHRPRSRAWFSDDEAAAVQDFWKIYRPQLAQLEPDPEVQAALALAVDSLDFGAYEALLSRGGAPQAGSGELMSALSPHLVHAYHDAPDRLAAALGAMGKFLARRSAVFAKVREQQLRELADSVEHSREEERTRIARELHDELAQQLTAIRMDLGWLLPRLPAHEARERVEAMDKLVQSIFTVIHRIGLELRPGLLDDLGLGEALEWQAAEFERRSGIAVQLDTDCPCAVGHEESTTLFRIFQEILTNVARHSQAQHVFGSLIARDGAVSLSVTDDGRGIQPEEIANPRSLGLLGMRERAELLGGSFHIEPGHGGGTTVSVTLPWAEGTRP